MQIVFKCPHCRGTATARFETAPETLTCELCQGVLRTTHGAMEHQRLKRCLACPSQELFVRKDFPQRLGVAVVITGFVLSSIAWYNHWIITTFLILFATALVDVALYVLMGDVVECYQCHAQYRGLGDPSTFGGFDLEVHEKHRQQRARLAD